MAKINLTIDNISVEICENSTILQAANSVNITIPTLCHDEKCDTYASCGICLVEVEGSPKLARACSTRATNGMVISTNTERVRKNRTANLNLLLSNHKGDCKAPCTLACPAKTDFQGYVGLIANGNFETANKLIKDVIPLPASIGRVCPHPCETACRRKLVEDPISIAFLKQTAGDYNLNSDKIFTPDCAKDTGKSVAIIGGGPGGLTAAYFLRQKGHAVTVFEAMPEMGGMLQYGIPQYRLPKEVLQREISVIKNMGTEFKNNIKIGEDIELSDIQKDFDATIIAAGAWNNAPLRAPGEEKTGVHSGIQFLQDVVTGKINQNTDLGVVAVVGGGNTAMDACRTAVRLGAKSVYNIYRRTVDEMPAEKIEITEAIEEGVVFKNLTNPLEIIGDERVNSIRLQKMQLGEPDTSGRRAPVAVEGAEEILAADTIIIAIGQKFNPAGFGEIKLTKWGTINADEQSFGTNLPGVFALGDAINDGASIAITAIGHAKICANSVDDYLNGAEFTRPSKFVVKDEKTPEDFANFGKISRAKMPHRAAEARSKDFAEVNLGLTLEAAQKEAARCLECGCLDYFECKLLSLSREYSANCDRFAGKLTNCNKGDNNANYHEFIRRNMEKCILCGLCVRTCEEVVGASALGYVNRGFATFVAPALGQNLADTTCISCGNCVAVCPTGALTDVPLQGKNIPLKETGVTTSCAKCSVGCAVKICSNDDVITRTKPTAIPNILCKNGKFGMKNQLKLERIKKSTPSLSFEENLAKTVQTLRNLDNIAVIISPEFTNEQAEKIIKFAKNSLKTQEIYSNSIKNTTFEPTATIKKLQQTDKIVIFDDNIVERHGVLVMKVVQAVRNGAKMLLISDNDSILTQFASMKISSNFARMSTEIKNWLTGAKSPTVVFENNYICEETAKIIEAIKCDNSADLLPILPGANTRGLINLGVKSLEKMPKNLDGVFVFAENLNEIVVPSAKFKVAYTAYKCDNSAEYDVILPAHTSFETNGTYTSFDGRECVVKSVVKPAVMSNVDDPLDLLAEV